MISLLRWNLLHISHVTGIVDFSATDDFENCKLQTFLPINLVSDFVLQRVVNVAEYLWPIVVTVIRN